MVNSLVLYIISIEVLNLQFLIDTLIFTVFSPGHIHSRRAAAGDEIGELLADFRNKRALGLGSLFGDHQLQGINKKEIPTNKVTVNIVSTLSRNNMVRRFCSARVVVTVILSLLKTLYD